MTKTRKAFVRKVSEIQPVDCPCGKASRIITAEDNDRVSVHRVRITKRAERHYHKILTETYVVLSGKGSIYLDGEMHPVEPGDVVFIPPRTVHALEGDFEIINVVAPPFDPSDEYIVDEGGA